VTKKGGIFFRPFYFVTEMENGPIQFPELSIDTRLTSGQHSILQRPRIADAFSRPMISNVYVAFYNLSMIGLDFNI
jgi:hypothetical protein